MDTNNIRVLSPIECVRLRPQVFFGNNDLEGAFETFKLTLDSILQRIEYKDRINVSLHLDGSISVEIFKNGLFLGWNTEKQKYNWDILFNSTTPDGYIYELKDISGGLVQFASKYYSVVSYYDDKVYIKHFTDGRAEDEELIVKDNITKREGLVVHWKLSKDVFTDTDITFDMLKNYCKEKAHLLGINFYLHNLKSDYSVEYTNCSLINYFNEGLKEKEMGVVTKTQEMAEAGVNNNMKCKVAITLSEEGDCKNVYFHNNSNVSASKWFVNTLDSVVSDFFNEIAKENNKVLQSHTALKFFNIVVVTESSRSYYVNSRRDTVYMEPFNDLIYKTIKSALREAKENRNIGLLTVIDKVLESSN